MNTHEALAMAKRWEASHREQKDRAVALARALYDSGIICEGHYGDRTPPLLPGCLTDSGCHGWVSLRLRRGTWRCSMQCAHYSAEPNADTIEDAIENAAMETAKHIDECEQALQRVARIVAALRTP